MTLEKQKELGEGALELIAMDFPSTMVNQVALLYLSEVNNDCKNGVGYDTRLYNSFVQKYQEYKLKKEKKIEDNYSSEDIQNQLNNVGSIK